LNSSQRPASTKNAHSTWLYAEDQLSGVASAVLTAQRTAAQTPAAREPVSLRVRDASRNRLAASVANTTIR
jgi:hypothetical protein